MVDEYEPEDKPSKDPKKTNNKTSENQPKKPNKSHPKTGITSITFVGTTLAISISSLLALKKKRK